MDPVNGNKLTGVQVRGVCYILPHLLSVTTGLACTPRATGSFVLLGVGGFIPNTSRLSAGVQVLSGQVQRGNRQTTTSFSMLHRTFRSTMPYVVMHLPGNSLQHYEGLPCCDPRIWRTSDLQTRIAVSPPSQRAFVWWQACHAASLRWLSVCACKDSIESPPHLDTLAVRLEASITP